MKHVNKIQSQQDFDEYQNTTVHVGKSNNFEILKDNPKKINRKQTKLANVEKNHEDSKPAYVFKCTYTSEEFLTKNAFDYCTTNHKIWQCSK